MDDRTKLAAERERPCSEAPSQVGISDRTDEFHFADVRRQPIEVTEERPPIYQGSRFEVLGLDDESSDVVAGRAGIAGLEHIEDVPGMPARADDDDPFHG